MKRSKSSRARGSNTHNGGGMKRRRGFGHVGGKGNAGTGKRADTKKPSLWKAGISLGKYGFVGRSVKPLSLNIRDLEKLNMEEKDGYFVFEGKVLGNGTPTRKYYVSMASKQAAEKITSVGGKVHERISE